MKKIIPFEEQTIDGVQAFVYGPMTFKVESLGSTHKLEYKEACKRLTEALESSASYLLPKEEHELWLSWQGEEMYTGYRNFVNPPWGGFSSQQFNGESWNATAVVPYFLDLAKEFGFKPGSYDLCSRLSVKETFERIQDGTLGLGISVNDNGVPAFWIRQVDKLMEGETFVDLSTTADKGLLLKVLWRTSPPKDLFRYDTDTMLKVISAMGWDLVLPFKVCRYGDLQPGSSVAVQILRGTKKFEGYIDDLNTTGEDTSKEMDNIVGLTTSLPKRLKLRKGERVEFLTLFQDIDLLEGSYPLKLGDTRTADGDWLSILDLTEVIPSTAYDYVCVGKLLFRAPVGIMKRLKSATAKTVVKKVEASFQVDPWAERVFHAMVWNKSLEDFIKENFKEITQKEASKAIIRASWMLFGTTHPESSWQYVHGQACRARVGRLADTTLEVALSCIEKNEGTYAAGAITAMFITPYEKEEADASDSSPSTP